MSDTDTSTTDHGAIRAWVDARGGKPARVGGAAARGGGGLLRIDFGGHDENLELITWDEFFRIFDEHRLAFVRQETSADGKPSRFNKFVHRTDHA